MHYQTNLTQEWWYTTAFFHDTKGQLYSLMFTNFKWDGKDVPIPKSRPDLVAQLGPNTTITQCMLALSNYDTGYRGINVGMTINNLSQIWQPEAN